MFMQGNVREYERTPFVKSIRYCAFASDTKLGSNESKRIRDTAVSVDISSGGLGMITGYPIEPGHVLTFEDKIEIDNFVAKAAIVRWTDKIINNTYRVGVKFV